MYFQAGQLFSMSDLVMVRFCILCKGLHCLCLLSWSSRWSLLETLYCTCTPPEH